MRIFVLPSFLRPTDKKRASWLVHLRCVQCQVNLMTLDTPKINKRICCFLWAAIISIYFLLLPIAGIKSKQQRFVPSTPTHSSYFARLLSFYSSISANYCGNCLTDVNGGRRQLCISGKLRSQSTTSRLRSALQASIIAGLWSKIKASSIISVIRQVFYSLGAILELLYRNIPQ